MADRERRPVSVIILSEGVADESSGVSFPESTAARLQSLAAWLADSWVSASLHQAVKRPRFAASHEGKARTLRLHRRTPFFTASGSLGSYLKFQDLKGMSVSRYPPCDWQLERFPRSAK